MAQKTHVQTTLLPPEVIEATLRIGVVGATDHVQVQAEIHDPGTGELLYLVAAPHRAYGQMDEVVLELAHDLLRAIRELTGPF